MRFVLTFLALAVLAGAVEVELTAGGAELKVPVTVEKTAGAEEDGTIGVLLEEIRATEELITRQQQKVGQLGALRNALLAGEKLPSNFDIAKYLQTAPTSAAPAATGRPQMEPARRAAPQAPSRQMEVGGEFDDYMVLRGEIELTNGASVVKVMSLKSQQGLQGGGRRKRAGETPNDLVVIGDKSGSLHFYLPEGEHLLSYPTGHADQPIVHLSNDFSQRRTPRMVTATADGSVHTHILTVWWNGRLVMGTPRLKEGAEELSAAEEEGLDSRAKRERYMTAPKPEGLAVEMMLEHIISGPTVLVEGGDEGAITSVASYAFRQIQVTIVGDSVGNIRMYSSNGTLRSMTTAEGGRPVVALKQLGTRLAFGTGHDVQFLNIAQRGHDSVVCKGITSDITDIGFDVLLPSIVYAATSNGDVLVFNTRSNKGGGGNRNNYDCTLAYKLSGHAGGSTKVLALKGYMLRFSANSGQLAVYNSTQLLDEGVRLMFNEDFKPATEEGAEAAELSGAPISHLSSSTIYRGRNAADKPVYTVVGVDGASSIKVYQALLPYKPPVYDMNWVRTPMMVIGAIVVFTMFFRMKNKGGGGGGDMPPGMANMLQGMGGAGGGMGGMGGRGGGMGGMGGGMGGMGRMSRGNTRGR